MNIENIIGLWGDTEHFDTQLNILPGGKVNISLADVCEYGINAKAVTIDDGVEIRSERFSARLVEATREGQRVLIGNGVFDGKTDEYTFWFGDNVPMELGYHFAPKGEPVSINEAFPLNIDALVGSYEMKSPFFVEMNIFNVDGNMLLLLSFDKRSKWVPAGVWMDNDSIVWMINDSLNRNVFRLYPVDGGFEGYALRVGQNGRKNEVRFEKISSTPADRNKDPIAIPLPDKSREEILKDNKEFSHGETYIQMDFVLGGELPHELEKYGFSSYIDGKHGDEVAFACLDFMGDNFHHTSSGMPDRNNRDLKGILQWCDEHGGQTNCRGLSIMLASLLRYNGIKAQHVTCCPYEEPFMDCHVVVDCILPSGKRVMLDPTYRGYLLDKNGEYVSLPRLRHLLIDGEELNFNADVKYTGKDSDWVVTMDYYREYMSKNSIRYLRDSINADGRDENDCVLLYPIGYPIEEVGYSDVHVLTTDEDAFWNL